MSFSDSLENHLQNLESREEREAGRPPARPDPRRARIAADLRNGPFTRGLLTQATRLGHGLRTKVRIVWLGDVLRLEAREHRLELRPEADCVVAVWLRDGVEARTEKIDLGGNPEALARRWLQAVGPPPVSPPLQDAE